MMLQQKVEKSTKQAQARKAKGAKHDVRDDEGAAESNAPRRWSDYTVRNTSWHIILGQSLASVRSERNQQQASGCVFRAQFELCIMGCSVQVIEPVERFTGAETPVPAECRGAIVELMVLSYRRCTSSSRSPLSCRRRSSS